jgi:putative copper export protein
VRQLSCQVARVDTPSVVRFFHLLAAAVWTGGLIVMAALVVALRRAGAERPMLQAAARQFARVSWVAMAVAVATGVYQVMLMNLPWTYGRLHMKMGLVGLVVVVTVVHQIVAKRLPPAGRGAVEGTILLLSLGIFAAAVAL